MPWGRSALMTAPLRRTAHEHVPRRGSTARPGDMHPHRPVTDRFKANAGVQDPYGNANAPRHLLQCHAPDVHRDV